MREAWHPANVAGGEGDAKAVWRGIGQTLDAIGPKVMVFTLLPVGNDRRSCRFELGNCVFNSFCIKRIKALVHAVANGRDRIDQFSRTRNAANWFSRNDHRSASLACDEPYFTEPIFYRLAMAMPASRPAVTVP